MNDSSISLPASGIVLGRFRPSMPSSCMEFVCSLAFAGVVSGLCAENLVRHDVIYASTFALLLGA